MSIMICISKAKTIAVLLSFILIFSGLVIFFFGEPIIPEATGMQYTGPILIYYTDGSTESIPSTTTELQSLYTPFKPLAIVSKQLNGKPLEKIEVPTVQLVWLVVPTDWKPNVVVTYELWVGYKSGAKKIQESISESFRRVYAVQDGAITKLRSKITFLNTSIVSTVSEFYPTNKRFTHYWIDIASWETTDPNGNLHSQEGRLGGNVTFELVEEQEGIQIPHTIVANITHSTPTSNKELLGDVAIPENITTIENQTQTTAITEQPTNQTQTPTVIGGAGRRGILPQYILPQYRFFGDIIDYRIIGIGAVIAGAIILLISIAIPILPRTLCRFR